MSFNIDNIVGLVPHMNSHSTETKTNSNHLQKLLNDLNSIYLTQLHKSALLQHKEFIQNARVQSMLDLIANLMIAKDVSAQLVWDLSDEIKYGTFLAACFHATSLQIRDLEFEISDQKSNLYQVYIGVFNNLLVITNRLLLLFTGKFSEVFMEKKGLVSVLTFLKIKNFINRLKTKINLKVLMSLIEHLRIQSRYTDKDQKLWLNISVFDILLGSQI